MNNNPNPSISTKALELLDAFQTACVPEDNWEENSIEFKNLIKHRLVLRDYIGNLEENVVYYRFLVKNLVETLDSLGKELQSTADLSRLKD